MRKSIIFKMSGMVLLTVGIASIASAVNLTTPEIDAATGVNALALLSGALLIIRGRKR
jgi:hypothetical protein